MNSYIKRLLLALCCCGGYISASAQNIVQAEYYIDSDPGPGKGTAVAITSGNLIDQNFAVNVTGLDVGIHELYIRTRQDNGLWSFPELRYFYILDSVKVVPDIDRNIYQAEYFIDEDPGIGNGIGINFTSTDSASINFSLPVTDLTPGMHHLYLRTHQDDGLWSIAKRVPFFVMDTISNDLMVFNTDIVAAEYFFDQDPGPGNGIPLPLQKGDSVNHRPWAASTEGLEVGRHWLYLRAKSEDGLWNTVARKEVFIFSKDCIMPKADFSFDTVAVNTTVGLTDLSTNVQTGATYQWDVMGDGTVEGDSVVFDASFSTKGVYPVKLTVTNPDGCFTSKVKDVYVTDGFPSDITLSANDSLFVGDTVTLTAPAGFTYEWNNGATTSAINVTEEGTYYVWLSDGNITYRSKKVTISYFEPVTATVAIHDASSGLNNGVATLSEIKSDGLPYSISWSNGTKDKTQLIDLAVGSYSVTVTTSLESKIINFTIGTRTDTTGIIAAEYFINTDPGPGKGTALNIPHGDNIEYQVGINTSGFTTGLNKVYFRMRQSNGLWGIAAAKTFYVIDSVSAGPSFTFGGDIVYAEYAIDTMPSVGNAIPITLTATGQLIDQPLTVDVSTLSLGEHKIFIRTRDSNGNWSFEKPMVFRVCNSVPAKLVAADTTVCKGSSLTYSINGTAGTYNWYNNHMELIHSSVDTFLTVYNIMDSALYYVSQKNAEGCESAKEPFSLIVKDPQVYAGNDMEVSVYLDSVAVETHIPQGGYWSGWNISSNGKFSPSNAGLGIHEVTYHYDTLNCTATDILQINVTDEVVNQPPVAENQIFSIDENSPLGTVIGTITASDPNNDPLKYTFQSGNESKAFSMDTTGVLTIADSAQFDFEINQSFALVIKVSDGLDSVSANITVNVNDILEGSPLEADSLVLVALFNSTGGEGWTNRSGWLTENLAAGWHGITIRNDRVAEVKLPSNNLAGYIPVDITRLDSLDALDVSNNNLTDLPDLSAMTSLSSVNVSGNKLTFEDLEMNAGIVGIIYAPQADIGTKDQVLLPVHSDTTIYIDIAGSANHYQWFHNGNPVGTDLGSYTITNITRTNMGAYHVAVTNDLVPGLTISSLPDDVMAGAALSGIISDDAGNIVAGGGEVLLLAIRSTGAYDTLGTVAPIQSDGSYSFEKVLLQDYIAISITDTLVHPDLLPTYYAQAIFWEEADTIFLETNSSAVNIIMVTYSEQPLGGEGVISGYVEELLENAGGKVVARGRVKNAGVSIRRGSRAGKQKLIEKSKMLEDLELVGNTSTDQDGLFSFTQLTDDVYYLNVQYPGYPMDENSFVEIPIGDATNGRVVAHKDKVEVEALVAEGKITVTQINVTRVYSDEIFRNILVYPNPASTNLNIDLSAYALNFDLEIYDQNGRLIMNRNKSSGKVDMDLSHLKKGIYYLRVFSEDKLATTFKIVVK